MSYPNDPQWQPQPPTAASPYGPPPQRNSRTWLWVLIAAVVVVGVAATVAIVLVTTSGDDAARGVSNKPDITKLTSDMVLPESGFPALPSSVYRGYPVEDNPKSGSYTATPAECGLIANGPKAKQRARARVKSNTKDPSWLNVALFLTDQRTDLKSVLSKCTGEVRFNGNAIDVRALDAPGVPSWAVAFETSGGNRDIEQYVGGYYRGVLIIASYQTQQPKIDQQRTDDLAKVFKAQADRLEAQT